MNEPRFGVSLNQAPPCYSCYARRQAFPSKWHSQPWFFFSNFDEGHFKENHIQFFWRNSSDIWGSSAQKRARGRWSNVKGVQIEVKARHSSWRTRASEQVLNVENPNDISTSAMDWTLHARLELRRQKRTVGILANVSTLLSVFICQPCVFGHWLRPSHLSAYLFQTFPASLIQIVTQASNLARMHSEQHSCEKRVSATQKIQDGDHFQDGHRFGHDTV